MDINEANVVVGYTELAAFVNELFVECLEYEVDQFTLSLRLLLFSVAHFNENLGAECVPYYLLGAWPQDRLVPENVSSDLVSLSHWKQSSLKLSRIFGQLLDLSCKSTDDKVWFVPDSWQLASAIIFSEILFRVLSSKHINWSECEFLTTVVKCCD